MQVKDYMKKICEFVREHAMEKMNLERQRKTKMELLINEQQISSEMQKLFILVKGKTNLQFTTMDLTMIIILS